MSTSIRVGDDVRYTGKGGYAKDRAKASAVLTVGTVYRVKGRYPGQYFTSLTLYEVESRGRFSASNFASTSSTPGSALSSRQT